MHTRDREDVKQYRGSGCYIQHSEVVWRVLHALLGIQCVKKAMDFDRIHSLDTS